METRDKVLIGIGIGLIVVIAYVIYLNRKKTQILSDSIGLNALKERMDLIEQKLDRFSSGSGSVSDSSVPMNPMTQIQENEEECIIKTNEKGRILGFTTHRKLFQK